MCQLSIVGTRGVHGCGLCITLDTHTKCFCVVTLCLVDCGVLRVPYDIHLLYLLGGKLFSNLNGGQMVFPGRTLLTTIVRTRMVRHGHHASIAASRYVFLHMDIRKVMC